MSKFNLRSIFPYQTADTIDAILYKECCEGLAVAPTEALDAHEQAAVLQVLRSFEERIQRVRDNLFLQNLEK